MNGTTMNWHLAEGKTNKAVGYLAVALATWVGCSAYYNIPELLHEHGKLVSIERNRSAISAERQRAINAELANSKRIDAILQQLHDMENRNVPKAAGKAKR